MARLTWFVWNKFALWELAYMFLNKRLSTANERLNIFFSTSNSSDIIIYMEMALSIMALVCVVSTSLTNCQNVQPVLSSVLPSDTYTEEITSSTLQ
jgi:hypothetical protein